MAGDRHPADPVAAAVEALVAEPVAAIEAGFAALDAADPADDLLPVLRHRLGAALLLRVEGNGLADLEAAVALLRAARDTWFAGDEGRWAVGHDLGVALTRWTIARPSDTDQTADFTEALAELAIGRAGIDPDDPDFAELALANQLWSTMAKATRFFLDGGNETIDRDEGAAVVAELDALLAVDDHALNERLRPIRALVGFELASRGQDVDKVREHAGALDDWLGDLAAQGHAVPVASRALLSAIRQGDSPLERASPELVRAGIAEVETDEDLSDAERAAVRSVLSLLLTVQESGGELPANAFAEVLRATTEVADRLPRGTELLRAVTKMVASAGSAEGNDETEAEISALDALLARLPADDETRAELALRRALSALLTASFNGAPDEVAAARDALLAAAADERAGADADVKARIIATMADGLVALGAGDTTRVSELATLLSEAAAQLPAEHGLRGLIDPAIGSLLLLKNMHGQNLEQRDRAVELATPPERPVDTADLGPRGRAAADLVNGTLPMLSLAARWTQEPVMTDPAAITAVLGDLVALRDQAGADTPAGKTIDEALETVGMMAALGGGFDPRKADLSAFLAGADAVLARPPDPGMPPAMRHYTHTVRQALALSGKGMMTRDRRLIDQAVALLGPLAENVDLRPQQRIEVLEMSGNTLGMRYTLSGRRNDLSLAIHRYEQARRLIRAEPGVWHGGDVLKALGDSYFQRADAALGDRDRAVAVGLEALAERSADVLLQSDTRYAWDKAVRATGDAVEVARWGLVAERLPETVLALEIGRAMALHAANSERDVPDLLRARGEHDLAERWAQSFSDSADAIAPARVPNDLRREVLVALDGTPEREKLFSAPTIAEIAAAVDRSECDALVYLLPAGERVDATAVLVHRDGTVTASPISARGHEPLVAAFEAALAPLYADPAADAGPLRAAVAALADWAWPAAIAGLVGFGPRPKRLVLVPVGALASVPWHAARRRVTGGHRYACEDAVISYAASARQFVAAAARGARDWTEAPAVVRVASSRLFWSSQETETLHANFYPHGVYLGARDRRRHPRKAVAKVVREVLRPPGPSLVHFGCHAHQAVPPVESYLELGGQSALRVRDLIADARDRPANAPGALVVLAACASDVTGHVGRSGHDEPLSLASTFLAAGAAGVVGSRWPVPDVPTALLMTMFHHYLNRGYDDPATALRAAQLWLLDAARRVPPTMNPKLAEELPHCDPTDVAAWAAFTYQGR
ncbi:CHAT domain-containing protein [Actinokineospora iranica]|uniref:CHAT domain-containing protein n=1 Tax=Actinokineospora iranica TaxID=1271860 RepID=A0A1G6QD53_9PSEU|nr:CHAT domain-containing protein [Actinokineospora iranica]SDC89597.1 CHAT domain-containing protein [Actinokineospora iranica]